MKRNAHPSNFYIAHALFEGDRFRAGGEWGMLTDGPADRDDLRVALTNHFDAKPDLDQVKVWLFQDDATPREVTEDVIDADFTDDGDDEFDHWISRRPFHAYSEAAE